MDEEDDMFEPVVLSITETSEAMTTTHAPIEPVVLSITETSEAVTTTHAPIILTVPVSRYYCVLIVSVAHQVKKSVFHQITSWFNISIHEITQIT